jgi:hypothetical protein
VPFRHQDVFRLDVAMHHPIPVGIRQGVGHLPNDANRLGHRQLTLALQLGPQGFAGDEGHDVIEEIAGRAGGQQGNDVRVLQSGREPDLPLEPLGVHPCPHLGRQDLDDHLAREPRLLGEEDAAHPTTP